MTIFEKEPKDWIDLQDKVAYVLEHCGYSVETPKVIKTGRGTVEVDVYAKNEEMKIVCECKYWEGNIPQNIAFAFRTIVDDIGANKGIIVAKKGFQLGTYSSIKNTNIEIYTWKEFMEIYKEKYIKFAIRQFIKIKRKVFRLASDKSEYWQYIDRLDPVQRKEVWELQDRLFVYYFSIASMCHMLQNEDDEELGWDSNYLDTLIAKSGEFHERLFDSYFDFFEYINKGICEIVLKFEDLYKIKILSIE